MLKGSHINRLMKASRGDGDAATAEALSPTGFSL